MAKIPENVESMLSCLAVESPQAVARLRERFAARAAAPAPVATFNARAPAPAPAAAPTPARPADVLGAIRSLTARVEAATRRMSGGGSRVRTFAAGSIDAAPRAADRPPRAELLKQLHAAGVDVFTDAV